MKSCDNFQICQHSSFKASNQQLNATNTSQHVCASRWNSSYNPLLYRAIYSVSHDMLNPVIRFSVCPSLPPESHPLRWRGLRQLSTSDSVLRPSLSDPLPCHLLCVIYRQLEVCGTLLGSFFSSCLSPLVSAVSL